MVSDLEAERRAYDLRNAASKIESTCNSVLVSMAQAMAPISGMAAAVEADPSADNAARLLKQADWRARIANFDEFESAVAELKELLKA